MVFLYFRIISIVTAVLLTLGTCLDLYLQKNGSNPTNGFMFDNYKYAVSDAKLQTLSEHAKIDMESGEIR